MLTSEAIGLTIAKMLHDQPVVIILGLEKSVQLKKQTETLHQRLLC